MEAKPGQYIAFKIQSVKGNDMTIRNGNDNGLLRVKYVMKEEGVIIDEKISNILALAESFKDSSPAVREIANNAIGIAVASLLVLKHPILIEDTDIILAAATLSPHTSAIQINNQPQNP